MLGDAEVVFQPPAISVTEPVLSLVNVIHPLPSNVNEALKSVPKAANEVETAVAIVGAGSVSAILADTTIPPEGVPAISCRS
jgi:hypothetical protein